MRVEPVAVSLWPNQTGYCSNTWEFVDWEGPVNEEDHYETVKMDADKTITADFIQATVQITGADICDDTIGIQLGGTGLIGLLVVTLNAAAYETGLQQFLEAVGFAKEGTLREALFIHDAYHDVHLYGLATDKL